MTVTTTENTTALMEGNGVNMTWPFTFRVLDASDLVVYHRDIAGVITELSANDYTVTIDSDGVGGSVEYPLMGSPVPDDEFIFIDRIMTATQTTNLRNQGGWFPEVVERVFDRLTMLVQQALNLNPVTVLNVLKTVDGAGSGLDADLLDGQEGIEFAQSSTEITTSGLAVGGGDLTASRNIDVPIASQAEAEAGAINTKAMTPLRTAEAIAFQQRPLASQAEAEAGAINTKDMSPLRVAQAIDALAQNLELASQAEAEAGTDNAKYMSPLRVAQAIADQPPGAGVPESRTVTGAGLATGGGDLSTNRVITVTESSQAQAEAGTDQTTAMSPLRVAQAIAAQPPGAGVQESREVNAAGLATGGGDLSADRTITVTESSQAQAEAGTNQTTAMTPLRTAQAIAALVHPSGIVSIDVFTSGGTLNRHAEATHWLVIMSAGGGGGGGSPATGAGQVALSGGGQAGQYIEGIVNSPPSSATVTIGAAGTGGVPGNVGSAGGDTSLVGAGLNLVAKGGAGGFQGSVTSPPAMVPITGNITAPTLTGLSTQILVISGFPLRGDYGIALSASGGNQFGGAGGENPLSIRPTGANAVAPTAGGGYGTGGAGVGLPENDGAESGGVGRPGVVIVYQLKL